MRFDAFANAGCSRRSFNSARVKFSMDAGSFSSLATFGRDSALSIGR
jgi:hypothetical protein